MSKENKKVSFLVKKTNELKDEEIKEINDLFNKTFENRLLKPRSMNEFIEKFSRNFLKFSFHGLMIYENKIIGCYHVIPYEFKYFSNKQLFGQSVDTTIDINFRGNIFNLKKLAYSVYDELKKFNIFFVYGIANEKFYPVKKRILGWNDIGELNYYIYPNNLKKILRKINFLNFLICGLLKLYIKLNINIEYIYSSPINKIDNLMFEGSRYDNNYIISTKKNIKFVYRTVTKKSYNNAKFIYLIDVLPLTKKNIEYVIEQILISEKDIDMILYVGNLKITPRNFYKIPKFFTKKPVIISGKILENSIIDNNIFDNKNWNLNLSNFDII